VDQTGTWTDLEQIREEGLLGFEAHFSAWKKPTIPGWFCKGAAR
jgi:hypothetical protein